MSLAARLHAARRSGVLPAGRHRSPTWRQGPRSRPSPRQRHRKPRRTSSRPPQRPARDLPRNVEYPAHMSSGYWGGDTPLGNAERVSLAIRTHDWTRLLATPPSHKTTPGVPLLAKLGGGGMPRPDVDPELAGGLREWLEDSLAGSAASLPRRSPLVRVNKQILTDVVPGGKLAGVADHRKTAHDRIFRSLMLCLFRQWVTTRRFGQPIEDALAALEVQGDPGGTVQAVNRLSPEMRQALSDETAAHAARIAATWPVLCPA